MASKTDIFNMALMELGISSPITNGTINTDNKAIILNTFYDNARDEVLKAFDWNFAEKFKTLALSEETEFDPRYLYCFDYPQDCLNAREIFSTDGDKLKKKFKISSGETGNKIILANVNPAILKYTRKITNEAFFTSEFCATLALYLAGLAGKALTGSEQKANNALKKYWDRLKLSEISNASEGEEVDEDNKTYLDAR